MIHVHPFETALSVQEIHVEGVLSGVAPIEWLEFWLNPRRLRGSDFLMRWSQGVWSEQRIVEAINETGSWLAVPYGPSGVAPTDDVRAYELYFERLEKAGLGKIKRPDLLIFRSEARKQVEGCLQAVGGAAELPFTPEDNKAVVELLRLATIAVECENSLWRGARMPDYGSAFTPQRRLGGKPGLKKTAVLPTIIIKEEDRKPLLDWQAQRGVPVHVWHVFFDRAYGLALDRAEELLRDGLILPREQVFQAPGGATTKKTIYNFYYQYAYPLGTSVADPHLLPAFIEDKNGHILPYVRFSGGKLELKPEALEVLERVSAVRRSMA
ncbi:MAG: AccI family restriction endonuclease [Verrucomicrobiae bacterium]|nr:AccI family restriction endonuclease [Verrucomicrobiae bacterium]